MRGLAIALLLGLTAPAVAYAPRRPVRVAPKPAEFWRGVLEPHGDEVDALLDNVRDAVQRAEGSRAADLDVAALELRDQALDDVFHILKYARRLSPTDTRVLVLLGHIASDLGKTAEAIEALQASVSVTGPEKAGSEVTGRLGLEFLKLGQVDDAVRWLEIAVNSPVLQTTNGYDEYEYGMWKWSEAEARVYLATAYALRHENHRAIELLSRSMFSQITGTEPPLAQFALAVQFDRDDQRGAAFEVLDKMKTQLQESYSSSLEEALSVLRYTPAEDRHYYNALFYETLGAYTEARAEWIVYANAGDTPYRLRALEHVALIDAQRRAPIVHEPGLAQPGYPQQPAYLRKIRHP